MNHSHINQSANHEPVTLWGSGLSPFVRKVQVALEEKKIPYEHKQILPTLLLVATNQPVPETFQAISPLGKIPALQWGSFAMADSSVICAFLDKKCPHGQALYPQDPESLARALWFENYADITLTSVIHQKLFVEAVVKPKLFGTAPNKDIIEEAQTKELPPLLDYLENAASQSDWLAGDDFSIADVAIVTHLISAELAGFSLDKKRWQALANLKEKVMARDSFKKL